MRHDRVLVRDRPDLNDGDTIIERPDTASQDGLIVGEVLAVGPGPLDPQGNRMDMGIAVGDIVVYSRYSGTELDENEPANKKTRLAWDHDVLSIVDEIKPKEKKEAKVVEIKTQRIEAPWDTKDEDTQDGEA